MYNFKKSSIVFFCLLMIVLPIDLQVVEAEEQDVVENVILMIPDGFSTSYVTSYRIFKGEELVFDPFLIGMMKTNSANSWVTDSAAAATAMSTGVKTNNKMIGVTPDGQILKTILEGAKESGRSTGLVTTVSITDATPAAFGAHVISRKDQTEIAKQLITKVDVLLGGGKCHFLSKTSHNDEQANTLEVAKASGYYYLETRDQLLNLSGSEEKVLGLFAEAELTPVIDKRTKEQPSLEEMTTAAIQSLHTNDKGFFLMIEGGQIDRAGHVHDPVWAMNETKAFEEAVEKVLDFAKENGKTLVVIAGDHDTGGMSVSGYDEYVANVELLKEAKATGNYIASKLNYKRRNAANIIKEYTGIKLTKKEAKQIKKAKKKEVAIAINHMISKRAYIGWTTHVHSGTNVPIYAFGPRSNLFSGNLDNTDIPKKIAEVMGVQISDK